MTMSYVVFSKNYHVFCLIVQPRSCNRAMKAVGVVEATCEEIFELVMSMDGIRYEYVFFLAKLSFKISIFFILNKSLLSVCVRCPC